MATATKEKSEALQYFEKQLRHVFHGRTEMEKLLLATDRTFDDPLVEAVWREVQGLVEYRVVALGSSGATVRGKKGGMMFFDGRGILRVKVGNLS